MWEAVANPGQCEQLLDWVRATAAGELGGTAEIRVFSSADDRVVLIATSTGDTRPRILSEPSGLVCRAPHQWLFREVTAPNR